MNKDSTLTKEENELIDKYLDGQITHEEGEVLETLLRESEEARKALRIRATIDEHLGELALPKPVGLTLSKPVGLTLQKPVGLALSKPESVPPADLKYIDESKQVAPSILIWHRMLPWCIAAMLAVALFIDRLNISLADVSSGIANTFLVANNSLGQLVNHSDATLESHAAIPQSYKAGTYQLNTGVLHIRLNSGVNLVFKAPASFEVKNDQLIQLKNGGLRVINPQHVTEMVVETPAFQVKRGWEFGVRIDAKKNHTQVTAFDGDTQVFRLGEKKPFVTLDSGKSMSPDRPLRRDFLEPGDIGITRWQKWRNTLREDKSLIAFYDFEMNHKKPNQLIDIAANRRTAADGQIAGPHSVSGRWVGKQALLFDSEGDHVALKIPGKYKEFSISTWIKLERLDYVYNALLNTNDWPEGALHFQVKRTGMSWIHVRGMGGRKDFVGKPLLLNQWQHVVATVSSEAGLRKTYVNGELIWRTTTKLRHPIQPGDCRIGDWLTPREWKEGSQRTFKGRMDEMAIFDRALTEEEIKQHYKVGRPDFMAPPRNSKVAATIES